MRVRQIMSGRKFTIVALELGAVPLRPECPAEEYLTSLGKDNPASHKSLLGVLRAHADQGPLLNPKKSRDLRDDIYEFKSRQGARLLWFYGPGRQTILTHGFFKAKGSPAGTEIDKAVRLRAQFFEEQ
jgi:hypothetical protein